MTTEHERSGALEAVDRIVNRGGDADDILREALAVLDKLYPHAAIRFDGEHQEGTVRYPIDFEGTKVAELQVAMTGTDDDVFLRRVATLLSAYCRPRKVRSTFRG